jgi:succinate dehydrogenase hydrophobic anchor subunit
MEDNFFGNILQGVISIDIIPGENPGDRVNLIIQLLSNSLILFLTLIIIVAIVYAALAGLKYIRSQGEADKVEEAQNSIKYVFIGILTVFLGIIVVVLLTGIFVNPGSEQVRQSLCLFFEPDVDREACVEGSDPDNIDIIQDDEI